MSAELAAVLDEIDFFLEEDRAIDALALVEELWEPDSLPPEAHLALASRGMVASYTIAEYHDAATWLERARKHASPDAQPYLGLLGAAFQRLSKLSAALSREALRRPGRPPRGGDAAP